MKLRYIHGGMKSRRLKMQSKTLSQCKNEIAIRDNFKSWEDMFDCFSESGSNGSDERRVEWQALIMFAEQFEEYYL